MTVKMFSRVSFATLAFACIDAAYAGSATWTNGSGTSLLNTTENWTAGGPPANSGDIAQWNGTVAGNLALTYNAAFGSSTSGVSLDITGSQTGSLQIGSTVANNDAFSLGNITIAANAGAFTFGNGTGNDRLVFRGTNTLTNDSANTATFASDVVFFSGGGTTRTLTFGGSGNWQVDAPLTIGAGGSGNFIVTKAGAGTLTLSGTNGYTGATTIAAGTLDLGGGTATGSISNSSSLVLAGGTLAYTRTGNTTQEFNKTSISSGASTLSAVTGNTLNLKAITRTAGATVNFDKTVDTGTISGSAGTGAGTLNGILPWGTVSNTGASAAGTSAGFTFGTYSGGNVVAYTAATSSTGINWTSPGANTVNYDVTGVGGNMGAVRSANSIRYVGTADHTTTFINAAGVLTLNALMNASTSNFTIANSSTGYVVIGSGNELVVSAAAGNITIGAPITGALGALTKTGTNSVTLTAANTYAGTTTISAGSLQIGNGGTSGSLSTSSTIINNGTLIINRSDAVAQGTDFGASAITGSGSLTQAGTGTTTLTAANTYSGATMVNGGALFVNGSLASAVNVASGATLGGTNTFTSAVTLASGAILSPGAATNLIGTLTLSGTAPALSGRHLVADVSTTNGDCDKLVLTGAVDLTGLTVTVKIPGTLPETNTYVLLSSTGTLTGTPTLAGDLSNSWYLSVQNNTLVLSKIFGTMISFF